MFSSSHADDESSLKRVASLQRGIIDRSQYLQHLVHTNQTRLKVLPVDHTSCKYCWINALIIHIAHS